MGFILRQTSYSLLLAGYWVKMDIGCSSSVVAYDSDIQTIGQFLEEWKPSSVAFKDIEWLTVSSEFVDKVDASVKTTALAQAWLSLCKSSFPRS